MLRDNVDNNDGSSGDGSNNSVNPNDPTLRNSSNQFAFADLVSDLAELTRAANRANTTIYTIDPRGLVGGPDLDEKIDMLNLINLFDSKSGLSEYMSFGQLSLYTPISSANNTTVTPTQPLIGYNLSSIMAPTFRKFLRDDLRSRWQMQLGGRIRF